MIVLDEFAHRQWEENFAGTRITTLGKEEFLKQVIEHIEIQGGFEKCSIEGYAPFCRHVHIPNIISAKISCMKITKELEPLIKTGYRARREDELPVLCRWIETADIPGELPPAKFLDLIFYSREQIIKESLAMNLKVQPGDWKWGLIAIKARESDTEIPMQPITAMRNGLGVEYGGSSKPIDPVKYRHAAEFWDQYISIQ